MKMASPAAATAAAKVDSSRFSRTNRRARHRGRETEPVQTETDQGRAEESHDEGRLPVHGPRVAAELEESGARGVPRQPERADQRNGQAGGQRKQGRRAPHSRHGESSCPA